MKRRRKKNAIHVTNNTKNVLVGTAAVSAIIVALYALTH
jgi:hypothetical protein